MTALTFPAFEPRRGQVRGETWWGRAWTRAMEDTSLDQGRLARGRTYARTGRVGAITVSPGRLSAAVYGTADEPYRTVVFVERLSEAEWDRLLEEVASRAGHIAALLDGEMPHDLVRAAADTGVRLLPAVGDLEPECDCLDWGFPCKHAAALCYQAAWLLDRDPFVLLLLRGRGQAELLGALRRRDRAAPGRLAGVPAGQAYARPPDPLPRVRPVPDAPPVTQPLPPAPGIDPSALRLLTGNAAARARDLLAGAARTLTSWQDAVRLAAVFPELEREELARAAAAWRYGGPAGLETFQAAWTPPKHEMARARAVLVADPEPPQQVREWRNRLTLPETGVQLRYGRDRRWYPYRHRDGEWWPAGTPDRDSSAALAGLAA